MPIFKAGPLPIRASMHGRPWQSRSGTSAAILALPGFGDDCAQTLPQDQRIIAARQECIHKMVRVFMSIHIPF
jgi:hypothetical protein